MDNVGMSNSSQAGNAGRSTGDGAVDETLSVLTLIAMISGVFLMAAVLSVDADTPQPGVFALCSAGAVFTGVYMFLGLVEIKLGRRLIELRSTLLLWVAFLACFGFLARIKAMSDINMIFHVDASLLPMTLLVASVMHAAAMLFIPIVVVGVLSLLFALSAARESRGRLRLLFCHLINVFTCLVLGVLISQNANDDAARYGIIYRVAHIADFSGFSPCKNIDPTVDDVLFVDANRHLAMVAPKIDDTLNPEFRKFSVFRVVDIPTEFPVLKCVY